jgi:hypothetical protein
MEPPTACRFGKPLARVYRETLAGEAGCSAVGLLPHLTTTPSKSTWATSIGSPSLLSCLAVYTPADWLGGCSALGGGPATHTPQPQYMPRSALASPRVRPASPEFEFPRR